MTYRIERWDGERFVSAAELNCSRPTAEEALKTFAAEHQTRCRLVRRRFHDGKVLLHAGVTQPIAEAEILAALDFGRTAEQHLRY